MAPAGHDHFDAEEPFMTTTSPTPVPMSERPSTGAETRAESLAHAPQTEGAAPPGESGASVRAPFTPPRLEALGPWRALTLQQSIPIGPGGSLRRS